MELIDGYDILCTTFGHSYVLLLVTLLDLYIFVVGSVVCTYMCGLVVIWVRRCFGFVCEFVICAFV